jgi:hypothetical protein
VGLYEGDTLVIDTTGCNDKTWPDMVGHPHSDELQPWSACVAWITIRSNCNSPSKTPRPIPDPFTAKKTFKLSSFPIGETMCSLSEDQSFQKNIMDRTVASPPAK